MKQTEELIKLKIAEPAQMLIVPLDKLEFQVKVVIVEGAHSDEAALRSGSAFLARSTGASLWSLRGNIEQNALLVGSTTLVG